MKSLNKLSTIGQTPEEEAAPTTKVCPFCKSANIEALPICEICGWVEDLNDLFVCEKCNDIITVEMAFAVANIQKQTGADKEVIINKIKEMYKE